LEQDVILVLEFWGSLISKFLNKTGGYYFKIK
jgi:hypothetical protein